jgi:hypothetical protein
MKGFVATVLSFALAYTHFAAVVIATMVDIRLAAPQALLDPPATALPDIHKLLRPPIV